MSFIDERVARLGFWITLLAVFFAAAPALYPGYWMGLEGFVPVLNAAQPGAVATIATQPDLWRGSGRATFLLIQPLMLLGASPTTAVRLTFVLALLLGGLGCYGWLRPRLGDRTAGLAALLYLLFPPFLATVYIRGSLSDALIVGLLPLVLAGIVNYVESHSPSAAAVVVLSLLWMWRIQAGLTVMATLLLLAYCLLVERSRLAALVVAATAAAGLASLIPLWSIQAPSPVNFPDHFVYFSQLFYGGWEIAPSVPGWQDGYPFQLGFAAIILSLVTLWVWRVRLIGDAPALLSRLLAFAFGGTLLLAFLSLNVSAPLWRLTGAGRLLTYPWQMLLLTAPLLAVSAGIVPMLIPTLQRAPLWLSLAGVVMLAGYPQLTTRYTQVEPPRLPAGVFGQRPDLLFLDARLFEDEAERTATLNVTWQVLHPLSFDYNVFFQAVTDTPDGETVLAQLDTQPRQGEEPATTWTPGSILTDTYQLDLPAQAPLGDVRYYFGYYDWRDNTRLPVNGGIDNKLILYGE